MVTAGILPFRKNSHGRTGNRTRDLMISRQRLTTRPRGWSFRINVEQVFKRTATDLDTQATMTQQRLTCVLKNAKLQSEGYCCLKNNGNKIFLINWRRVVQGFNVVP